MPAATVTQQTPNFSPAFDSSRVLAFVKPQAPMGKMPPPRTIVRFTPRGRKTFRANVNGQDRYNLGVWVDIDPADAGRVVKVVYDFVLALNPFHIPSDQARGGFSVTYEGYGCYGQVKATFYLRSPTEVYETPPFNQCDTMQK